MCQLEVDLEQVAQKRVEVELSVAAVVLASHLKVPGLALFENECVDHSAKNHDSENRIYAECFEQVVGLIYEVRILANLFNWRLEGILAPSGVLVGFPENVSLQAARDGVIESLEGQLTVRRPLNDPAQVGQDLDRVHELPDGLCHRDQAEGDQDEHNDQSIGHRGH